MPCEFRLRDVAACDAGIHGVNLAAGHQLRFLDRALNRLHRGFDVDHDALLEAARRMSADADDLERAVRLDLADDGDHLARADVEAHHQIAVRSLSHVVAAFLHASESSAFLAGAAAARAALRQPMAKPLE